MPISLVKFNNSLTFSGTTKLSEDSSLMQNLLMGLWNDGLITGFTVLNRKDRKEIRIFTKQRFKYANVKSLKVVLKSSSALKEVPLKLLWRTENNIDLIIISTSAGVISLRKCQKLRW